MQSIIDSSKAESRGSLRPGDGAVFLICCFGVLLFSALVSSFAPIGFSVATVFAFAGPHNWVELRYFLSRLPSKFGPLRTFFCASFAGVFLLGLAYATLITLARENAIEYENAIFYFRTWIASLHLWLMFLCVSRAVNKKLLQQAPVLLALCASMVVALQFPLYFGLALVYLHPLVGLWILERELHRSRPTWVRPYQTALALAAALLTAMVAVLLNQPSLAGDGRLVEQLSRHAGSFLLSDVSTHMLVSVHAFLEMLHYAVWLVAIPIATRALRRKLWQPARMPISRDSSLLKKIIAVVFLSSSLLVVSLWVAFLGDYSATRDLYFTVAVFHILAELPFLLWML